MRIVQFACCFSFAKGKSLSSLLIADLLLSLSKQTLLKGIAFLSVSGPKLRRRLINWLPASWLVRADQEEKDNHGRANRPPAGKVAAREARATRKLDDLASEFQVSD